MKVCFILILNLCLLSSIEVKSQNIFAQKSNQKIWEAKDRNDIIYTQRILKSGRPHEKVLALKGLYSWYDSCFRKSFTKLLKKGKPEVKIAVLDAIGQSKDSFYIPYLLKTIRKTRSEKVKETALVALGKCVTKTSLNDLKELKLMDAKGIGECYYRALLKGVNDPSLTNKVLMLFGQKDKENQLYAAWFMARTPYVLNASNYSIVADVLSESFLSGLSSDISIPLLISLGKAKVNTSDSMVIRKILIQFLISKDKVYSIEEQLEAVSALRALSIGKYQMTDSNLNFSNNKAFAINPSLQMNLSEWIAKNCEHLSSIFNFNYNPAIVNVKNGLNCHFANIQLTVTQTRYDQIWKLQCMEKDYTLYPQIKNILVQTDDAAIKTAATESLIKCSMQKGFPENLQEDFMKIISVLIQDADPGVLSVIANAFLEKSISPMASYDTKLFVDLFLEAKSHLKLPSEMETLIDIEKVIAGFNKTKFVKPIAEWNHPIDWQFVSKIPASQKIMVKTNKGTFIIKLNVNEAPASVGSILKLVDEGFYNGKYFHRLVPNFVIQGGCPRGDGYGSPDYTIRSEFSALKYTTAAVGLASSGPDTEGCQWFVTHCPTPHLDGRYTIIGYVIEGMDVVQQLGLGDIMLKVERH